MRTIDEVLIGILDRKMTEIRMCAANMGHESIAVTAMDSIISEPEEAHKAADLLLLGQLYHLGYHDLVESFVRANLERGFWYS